MGMALINRNVGVVHDLFQALLYVQRNPGHCEKCEQ